MKRALFLAVAASLLAALFFFSLKLAAMRIYDADECETVYQARILATGQSQNYFTSASLFVVPFAWMSRDATQSAELFASARLIMVMIFWLNLLLLAAATGERLLSGAWVVALCGAATLAPLWDHGLEIRHDNLLLAGLLLLWGMVRFRPANLRSCFTAGAIVVGLQFVAFEACWFALPISLAMLVCPPMGPRLARWKLALAWLAGGVAAFAILRLGYGAAGIWDAYVSGVQQISKLSSASPGRFAPWTALGRFLTEAPLLSALALAALVTVVWDLRRRGRAALSWDRSLPEALLFLGASFALLLNPTPHPSNLLYLAPCAFLFAYRYVSPLWKETGKESALIPLAGTILIFAHLVPFVLATRRHLSWPNHRQEMLMGFAEDMTDLKKDRVYDGVGLVPTRRSVDYQWFPGGRDVQSFHNGSASGVRDKLAGRPAAVFIPSYRTDSLPQADHDFIREHYVSLADDFWILGKVLPAGGGTFEIIHNGRYRISTLEGSNLAGTYANDLPSLLAGEKDGHFEGTIDGKPLADAPLELAVGSHRVESPAGCEVAVVWVGPKANRAHRLPPGDHRWLFYNLY